jgi:uncharacterized membrane protein
LIQTWKVREANRDLKTGLLLSASLIILLTLFLLLMIGFINWLPLSTREGNLLQLFLGSVGGSALSQVVREGFLRRLTEPGTILTLFSLGVLGFGMVFRRRNQLEASSRQLITPSEADHFLILLILGGMALTLIPEFVFLRDLFGYRINTIFKFYYQAWLMWSVVAAYGTISFLRDLGSPKRVAVLIGLVLSMVMALFYPALSLPSKTNNFSRPEGATLDGGVYFYTYSPFDAQAANWLRQAPGGVIAEAVGGSYSSAHARMATYSGHPNVLGWDFHEIQWRGSGDLVMPRKYDMAQLYCTHNWTVAKSILEKYQIQYLVVGDVEYSTYQAGEESCPNGLMEQKFSVNMITAFKNERLSIYTPLVNP